MVLLLGNIPQKEPIVRKLKGKVKRKGIYLHVGDVRIPWNLERKFLKRCRNHSTLQDAVDDKDFFLRGRDTPLGPSWFALHSSEFKPIPISEIEEIFSDLADKCTVRYYPQKERFQVNYPVCDVPQRMSLLVDSGDFGTYGGNAESAIKVGLSIFDCICTNWTLFLQKNKKMSGRAIHKKDEPDLKEIVDAQFNFANVVQGKWDDSKDILYTKDVVQAYANAYTKRSGHLRFFQRVLDRIGATTSGYDLAYSMTQEAQELADNSRMRMEMLAGEIILCPEQITEWYGKRKFN